MTTFSLGKRPHVKLCDLLKLEGWSKSGAQAKIVIAEGQVKVDGTIETRERCKIVAGQTVNFVGHNVQAIVRPSSWPVSTGRFSFQTPALYALFIHADNIGILPK